jgi:hypothetical protein
LDDQFLKQAVLALPLTLANACPIKNLEEGDWCGNDKKIFQDLIDNREGEIVIKQSYSWPIRFCFLSVKLKNDNFQDALDYLTSHNVAIKKSTKSIISKFESLLNQKNDTYKFFNLSASKFDNEIKLNSGTVSTVSSEKSKLKTTGTSINKESLSAIDETNLKKFEQEKSKFFEKLVLEKSNEIIADPVDYMININDIPKNFIQLDNESKFEIEISFIKNLFEFYVIDADKVDKYIILEEMLNELYANKLENFAKFSKKVNFNFVKTNNLCVARSTKDNRFYRAVIIDVSKLTDRIIVKYLDLGATDTLTFSDIFIIKKEFCKLPPSAIMCKLDSIRLPDSSKTEWPKEAIDFFLKVINFDKKYKAKICKSNPFESIECCFDKKIDIILLDQYSDNDAGSAKEWIINDEFINHGFAKHILKKDQEINNDDFDSVSVRNSKKYNIVNAFKKTEALNKNKNSELVELPPEDQHFRQNRISMYVDYQTEFVKNNSNQFFIIINDKKILL